MFNCLFANIDAIIIYLCKYLYLKYIGTKCIKYVYSKNREQYWYYNTIHNTICKYYH